MGRGPLTGVTGAVSASHLHLCEGVGRRVLAVVRGSRTLVDGLIEVGIGDNVCLEMAKKWKVAHEKNCPRFAD